MKPFNFETRELCPYREDWSGKDEPIIGGTLWYIKERDGIYLLNNKETEQQGPVVKHPDDEYCFSKGLPAAVLAQGEDFLRSDFNFIACYQAYYKEMHALFPDRPRFQIPSILADWEYTLRQLLPFDHEPSGYFHRLAMMRVGVFLRDMSNPYRIKDLVERIRNKNYGVFQYPNKEKAQVVMSDMPSIDERKQVPMIFAFDIDNAPNTAKIQAGGFMAAIINLALYHFWEKHWNDYNFMDINIIERIVQAYKKIFPIIDIVDLDTLSFDLPIEVEEICLAYMEAFEPIMRKVWKMKPEVQLECVEEDNIYTYIFAHEVTANEEITKSELYANLNDKQKRSLISYGRRFLEWMVKTYSITTAKQFRVMQAMSKDMPPIQLTIKNHVKVTRQFDPKKNAGKFRYIISDDKSEINKIHKRIELHLSSPAELRDELIRLQNEGLVTLPMESPTEIIREVRRLWEDAAPHERSFVTTWGRIKK